MTLENSNEFNGPEFKYATMLSTLEECGWSVKPDYDLSIGIVHFSASLNPDIREFKYTDALATLPITTKEQNVKEGIYLEVGTNGQVTVEYFGQLGADTVALSDAMANITRIDEEELDINRNNLPDRLLLNIIDSSSAEHIGELSDNERDLLMMFLNNPIPITNTEEFSHSLIRDLDGSLIVSIIRRVQAMKPQTDITSKIIRR